MAGGTGQLAGFKVASFVLSFVAGFSLAVALASAASSFFEAFTTAGALALVGAAFPLAATRSFVATVVVVDGFPFAGTFAFAERSSFVEAFSDEGPLAAAFGAAALTESLAGSGEVDGRTPGAHAQATQTTKSGIRARPVISSLG